MTVQAFEKKYVELQEKSKELLTQLTPLLKELKKVSKKALSLEEKADNDKGLYDHFKRVLGENAEGQEIVEMACAANGWNVEVLFRLDAFDCIDESATNIDAVLYNICNTPFGRKVD